MNEMQPHKASTRAHSVAAQWPAFVLALAVIALSGYGYTQFKALSERVASLEGGLASTTAALARTNGVLSADLAAQGKTVAQVQEQLGGFQNQVSSVTNSVDTLQKLSKLDPHLLEKYSKTYFLNENYVPSPLTYLPDQYKYDDSKQIQILQPVYPYLTNMLNQASSTGVKLYVVSGYRSFGTQANLKTEYTVVYGAGTANQFSADQGYSEHQLGTAVDLITPGIGGQLTDTFANTTAYTWLEQNAYKYGFTLSYPKGNSYYIFEPWHWRFVGIKLATALHDAHEYFYDLPQSTIDTYLISIFD